MRNVYRTSLALCLLINLGSVFANEVIKSVADNAMQAGFTEIERQLIIKYMGGQTDKPAKSGSANASLQKKKEQGLPPGLTQKKALPPGLAAQLQRNGTLPPGLAKRNLPVDLDRQLPPLRAGYERSILDDLTIVLVETATQRIVDVIFDAVTETDNNTSQGKNDR